MDNIKPKKYKRDFLVGFICGLACYFFLATAGIFGKFIYDNVLTHIYQKPQEADTIIYDTVLNERSIAKIEAIEDIIQSVYFRADNVTNEQLEEGLYRGLVRALNDPYAQYFTAEDLIRANANIEGIFFGIGALISYDPDHNLTVISGIIDGGSASESDLREGDYIIKVDDIDVTSYSSSEVVALIRGQEHTTVTVTILREGTPDFIAIELERRRVDKRTINHGVTEDENIGFIYISEFDNVTIGSFTEALNDLKDRGIRGLIIDVRSNPGGNVNSVTSIARQILPKGLIVYIEDRQGNRDEYTSDGRNELDIPIVVLVNAYTASAAEILAGAIQDHNKGIVIGQPTFGKGSVQRIITLYDKTAVKLTVSTYFTPNGRNLGEIGITPDIELKRDRDTFYEHGTDNQLQKAIEVLQDMIYQ